MLKAKLFFLILASGLPTTIGMIKEQTSNQQPINKSLIKQESLLNNKYHYLNNSNIILNQDKASGTYHVFDLTENLKFPVFSKYVALLSVDNKGNLQYDNTKVAKEDQESFTYYVNLLDAQQMKVNQNSTLNSMQLSNLCKTTDSGFINEDSTDLIPWTYLQFGGAENHTKLTGMGSDKVANYQDLSQQLGLHNIATTSILSDNIKYDLAKNFLKTSPFSTSPAILALSDSLINLSKNANVADFISNSPVKNDNLNYSIDYVLDTNKRLVSISYLEYDSNNFNQKVNLSINQTFDKNNPNPNWIDTKIVKLFKWHDYADTWEDFIRLYPTISCTDDSIIKYNCEGRDYNDNTNKISFSTNLINFWPNTKDNSFDLTAPDLKTAWEIFVDTKNPGAPNKQNLRVRIIGLYTEQSIYFFVRSASQSANYPTSANCSFTTNNWLINNKINQK